MATRQFTLTDPEWIVESNFATREDIATNGFSGAVAVPATPTTPPAIQEQVYDTAGLAPLPGDSNFAEFASGSYPPPQSGEYLFPQDMGFPVITPDDYAGRPYQPSYRRVVVERRPGLTLPNDVEVRDGVVLSSPVPRKLAAQKPYLCEADVVTNGVWVNPAAARIEDDSPASCLIAAGSYCTKLIFTGFGFNLPKNAQITGIRVTVNRRLK